MEEIRLAGIVEESIVDGPGIRYTIFTQGCQHRCRSCHNKETHSLDGGYLKKIDDIVRDIKENPLLDGVTISGGEPFLQKEAVYKLLISLRGLGLSRLVYTGYRYEELVELSRQEPIYEKIFKELDYLIDGPYEEDKNILGLKFRGSSNQRILNIRDSMTMEPEKLSNS